jgi:hypothetical protein
MLYDEVFPLPDDPACPNENCHAGMNLLRNSRKENMSQAMLRYECPHCHYRMTITTRNNRRINSAIAIGELCVIASIALGIAIEYFTLLANHLIVIPHA